MTYIYNILRRGGSIKIGICGKWLKTVEIGVEWLRKASQTLRIVYRSCPKNEREPRPYAPKTAFLTEFWRLGGHLVFSVRSGKYVALAIWVDQVLYLVDVDRWSNFGQNNSWRDNNK
jgi:hypothetical protein